MRGILSNTTAIRQWSWWLWELLITSSLLGISHRELNWTIQSHVDVEMTWHSPRLDVNAILKETFCSQSFLYFDTLSDEKFCNQVLGASVENLYIIHAMPLWLMHLWYPLKQHKFKTTNAGFALNHFLLSNLIWPKFRHIRLLNNLIHSAYLSSLPEALISVVCHKIYTQFWYASIDF